MTITIPPEALEAAAKADHAKWIDYASVGDDRSQYITWDDLDAEQKAEAIDRARAACLAMLRAWPGMHPVNYGGDEPPFLVLPLPQEKQNAK